MMSAPACMAATVSACAFSRVAIVPSGNGNSTIFRPLALNPAKYRLSCSRPRRLSMSSIGSSRSGRAISPRAALSSCWVRCSHSRKPVKSDGLTISRPSRNCILPFYSKGHCRARLRQLSVVIWVHREGQPPAFSHCEPKALGPDRRDVLGIRRAPVLGFDRGRGLYIHRLPFSPALPRREFDDRKGHGNSLADDRALGSERNTSRRPCGRCAAALEAILTISGGQLGIHPST